MQSFLLRKCLCIGLLLTALQIKAQTDADGIMMGKGLHCTGIMYGQGSWKNYWEGTLKRNNENLGIVSQFMVGPMGSLGVLKNFNVLFSLPYIQTKASAGQLKGFNGFQDLSLWGKYRFLRKKSGNYTISLFAIGGVSTPVQDYVKDYLPLSIGLGSRNLTIRPMADLQFKDWFATASASTVLRSNITIDRQVYYTTQMIYSNQVEMPNASQFNVRAGFRNKEIVAEVVYDQWTTLGGFDITKNNMPFPSNRMNQSRIGINGKYEPAKWKGISLTAAAFTTTAGRNIGKSTAVQFGTFYILNVAKKDKQKN
jgi:hypothetical protein